jgi:hypothetical protein
METLTPAGVIGIHVGGKSRPAYEQFTSPRYTRPVSILGHYFAACGGCDTLSGFDFIYDLVCMLASRGDNVLFEGLLLNSDIRRLIETAHKFPMIVLDLNTPIDVCVSSVNQRRATSGNATLVNPANTESKHKLCEAVRPKILAAGVNLKHVSREEAATLLPGLFE